VVLYGMIGVVGAKIWVENGVDFGDPVNLVGLAAGLIAGIGGVTLTMGSNFELSGIALGTIMVIVYFHLVNGRAGRGTGGVTRVLTQPESDVPTAHHPGHEAGRQPRHQSRHQPRHQPGHRADPSQE